MTSENKDVDKGLLDKILDYLTKNFGPNLPSNEEAIKKLKKELYNSTPATPESNKKLFPKGMPSSKSKLPSTKPKPRPKTRSSTVEAKKGGLVTRRGPMKKSKK